MTALSDKPGTSRLLVVSGPPGAGKSTVAQRAAQRFDRSALVEGDAFFGFVAHGAIEPWLPEANQQNEVVAKAAGAAAGRYALGGFTTVYDGLVGPWFLPTFLQATTLDHLEYVILLPSVERCVERVTTRHGHGFKDEKETRHMHREFVGADVEPRHVLLDPSDDPDVVLDQVIELLEEGLLKYANGSR